jgi:uncharacterized protein (DUF1778 family)
MSGKLPDIAPMSTTTLSLPSRKTERIEARVSPDFKELVKQAATLSGQSLSGYVLFALNSTTQRTLAEHQQATLTADESRSFVRALLSPPKPNQHLRSALAKYRQATGGAR